MFRLSYSNLKRIFFNVTRGQAKCIWFTDEALFSVTPTDQATFIYECIARYAGDTRDKIITEASGGFGGNTLVFAERFKCVNYVDIANSKLFEHNYEILRGKMRPDNVKIYNKDYLELIKTLDQDIVFMDPPWGGPDYKKYKDLKLYYSNNDVLDLAKLLFANNKCSIVAIKGPINFHVNPGEFIGYYVKVFPLNKELGSPLYTITIISKIPPKNFNMPGKHVFKPLGYKFMQKLKL